MRQWAPVLALALLALLVALFVGAAEPAGPSVDARRGEGYRGLFRVLEARGVDVARQVDPVDTLPPDTTFVLAGPLHRPYAAEEARALALWVSRGGHLVLLPDVDALTADSALLAAFELLRVEEDVTPPLGFSAWRAWTAERERRVAPDGRELRARDDRNAVACPASAEVLFTRPDGAARVCTWRRAKGRVTLVQDASVWSNARLGEADHLAFAVDLLGEGPVRFDERHRGAAPPAAAGAHDLGVAPDALLAHVLVLYGLAAWSLSRPFGPGVRRRDEPRPASTRELLALAELHRRGGHAREAGERLLTLARARQERRGEPADTLPATFEGGEAELVALAAEVERATYRGSAASTASAEGWSPGLVLAKK